MGRNKGKYDTGNISPGGSVEEKKLRGDQPYAEVIRMVENSADSAKAEKAELEKTARKEERCKRCISRLKIFWAFISCLISAADVIVIIVLSYLHFIHEHDIIAWLMLLPILLNFIGIFTFLSNDKERKELEELAGNCRFSAVIKNLMICPVIGPTFSAVRLFAYAFEEEDAEKFERLEALLTKMKQYESFFRAAPEAFIQITYRIVSWDNDRVFETEDYWTTACISLCIFALAESHMYGVVRPYYRMFIDSSKLPEDAWSIETITYGWRTLIFIFTFIVIQSRLMIEALWRASFCFLLSQISFGEVIAFTFIFQFCLRALTHGLVIRKRENWSLRKGILSPGVHSTDSGTLLYRAFTYSWRSIFMSFDFQSPDRVIQGWFYLENILMLATAYLIVYWAKYDLSEKVAFYVYTVISVGEIICALSIRLAVRYCMRRRRASTTPEIKADSLQEQEP